MDIREINKKIKNGEAIIVSADDLPEFKKSDAGSKPRHRIQVATTGTEATRLYQIGCLTQKK